jgi:hypothetical protein
MSSKNETAQHTPGPWTIKANNRVDDLEIRADDGSRLIANVYPQPDNNAFLISAAPDLLAACEAAWSILSAHGLLDDCNTGYNWPVGCMLDAAIAKAQGK